RALDLAAGRPPRSEELLTTRSYISGEAVIPSREQFPHTSQEPPMVGTNLHRSALQVHPPPAPVLKQEIVHRSQPIKELDFKVHVGTLAPLPGT
ncbi:hypothetical protein PIB30_004716, partial [Stylosanthes scabra]|nr:hypothetical protein [Stylosanthes scabra]